MSGKMKGKVSMERILAIYDVDQEYASRFADFMNSREKLPFTAVSFTSLEKLKAYAKEHAIEILLISEEMKDQVSDIEAGQVVALCISTSPGKAWCGRCWPATAASRRRRR